MAHLAGLLFVHYPCQPVKNSKNLIISGYLTKMQKDIRPLLLDGMIVPFSPLKRHLWSIHTTPQGTTAAVALILFTCNDKCADTFYISLTAMLMQHSTKHT